MIRLSEVRQRIADMLREGGGTLEEYARLKIAELDAREREKHVAIKPVLFTKVRGAGVQTF